MKIKKVGNMYVLFGRGGALLECCDTKKEARAAMSVFGRKNILKDIDRHHSWENLHDAEKEL